MGYNHVCKVRKGLLQPHDQRALGIGGGGDKDESSQRRQRLHLWSRRQDNFLQQFTCLS
jgi:hypothetical protein